MTNMEAFQPTETWPLQEVYKKRLHEKIQQWGEAIVPELEDTEDEMYETKTALFEFLMEAVPRGDAHTAGIITTLQAAMLESTRSWYTDKVGMISKETEAKMIRRDFNTLHTIYVAGRMASDAGKD